MDGTNTALFNCYDQLDQRPDLIPVATRYLAVSHANMLDILGRDLAPVAAHALLQEERVKLLGQLANLLEPMDLPITTTPEMS